MNECKQCGNQRFDDLHRCDNKTYDHQFVEPNLEVLEWKAKADKLAKALENACVGYELLIYSFSDRLFLINKREEIQAAIKESKDRLRAALAAYRE